MLVSVIKFGSFMDLCRLLINIWLNNYLECLSCFSTMFHSKTYNGGINKYSLITSSNNPRSFKRGVISLLSIQHWVFRCFIDFCPACCSALTLRGLLSTRDNMLQLSRVSTQGHFSLILISLPLTFSDSMHQSIFISTISSCPSATLHPPYSSSVLTFPSNCPLNPLLPCLRHPFITTGAVPSSALAWVHTHQAFLMLLHSAAAAAATVPSFPLFPLCLCLLFLSPGVVILPLAHSEVVSHRDYSQMSDDLDR